MKKVIKIIAGIIVVLLILALGAILSLPVTIAPLVKNGLAVGGPKVLGVEVSVGDVKLKPLAGQLTITDLVIGNPEGYSENDSFKVKTVDIQLRTGSILRGDTIYINKILIEDPAILYETKDGTSNFDKMLEMAKGAEQKAETEEPETIGGRPKKKVVISEFILQGSKVAYSSSLTFGKAITIPLPTVKVTDIGKESDGISGVEALGEIVPAIITGLKDAVTGAVSKTGDIAGDAAGAVGDAAGAAADAAGDAVEGATKKLKGLFGK